MTTLAAVTRRLVIGSALLLLLLEGQASANRLEVSSQTFRAVYSQMVFSTAVAPGGWEVRCPVTLEGTFHSRTFPKVRELLVGYVTRAVLNRAACIFVGSSHITILNGSERLLTNDTPATTLPWHIRYEAFAGTLPNITSVRFRIIDASILILIGMQTCLYRSTTAGPLRMIAIRNTTTAQITSLAPEIMGNIPKAAGAAILCPESIIMEGQSTVTVLGTTTTLVFIHLI